MTFNELIQFLKHPDEAQVNKAFIFLYAQKPNIQRALRAKHCTNKEDINHNFHLALLKLETIVKKETYTATTLTSIYALLKTIVLRAWFADPNNPESKKYKEKADTDKINQLGILDRNHTESIKEKENVDTLQDYIQYLIENLGDRCKKRIRYSSYFHEDTDNPSHSEIAKEMGNKDARGSIRALDKCKRKLKELIKKELEVNQKFNNLLNDLLGI